jgi:Zn-dependent protease
MDLQDIPRQISIGAIPVVLAITVPAVAAAYTAFALGDRTAQSQGLLSPNPLRYVTPVGTLVMPALLFFIHSPFLLGWPKSAPIDVRNFPHPRRDLALYAVSAPVANLLMAVLWAVVYGLVVRNAGRAGVAGFWLRDMAVVGLLINVLLTVWNLLPIPPLAGGRLLIGALPLPAARAVARLEPYGLWIILGFFMALSAAGWSLTPLIERIITVIVTIFA